MGLSASQARILGITLRPAVDRGDKPKPEPEPPKPPINPDIIIDGMKPFDSEAIPESKDNMSANKTFLA